MSARLTLVAAVIAHRGASQAAPENTVEAFRLARDLGADWVELDVRRTTDGVAVVHHDAHLADGRRIGHLHADELPGYVPSLAEALEACEGMGVHLEIKNLPDDPDYDRENLVADAVAGLIAAYLGPERAIVSSFNVDAADAVRAVDPTIPAALICGIVQPAQAGGGVVLCAGFFRGRYRDSLADPRLLQPGRPTRYSIELGDIACRFGAGHRVRLEVSSSNFPRFDPNPNTGRTVATETESRVAIQEVLHDREHPSALQLHVLPA